ncbi:hypothetical protein [Wenjunlia tyrosinilytica]|uniref:Uncharacterized protein n=1 Tax=Wenjunlia tyrosinilytica TaxID=1544741 RepID=A0A917ZUD0_9ACTN|nr:hypothetical protein [Wenjunlia tyrosinilytica]GGO95839.1 hypothetical protein GCM10012280_53930 [Wenjunlia tyrosinilytica]
MSDRTKYVVIAVVALILFILLPGWVKLAVIAVPVAGYLMLDPTQRRRLRRQSRKQIGR